MATKQELLTKLRTYCTPREWGQAMIELCKLEGVPLHAGRNSGVQRGFSTLCAELGIDRKTAGSRVQVAELYELMSPADRKRFDAAAKPIQVIESKKRTPVFEFTDGPSAAEAHKFRVQDAVRGDQKRHTMVAKFQHAWLKMSPKNRKTFLEWLYNRGDLVQLPMERTHGGYGDRNNTPETKGD